MGGVRIQKADVWGEPETRDKDTNDSCPSPLHPGNQVPNLKRRSSFSVSLSCATRGMD